MSYQDEQQKTEMAGQPELYEFHVGDVVHRYTSYAENLSFNGHSFLARPIKRSPFTTEKRFSPVTVDIAAPLIEPLVSMIANYPAPPVEVIIYRAVSTNMTYFRKAFTGVVKPIEIENKEARVTCESLTAIFRSKVPNVILQAPCNNRLFDAKCGLNSSAYKVTATVTVSGSTLVSTTFGGYSAGYFRKGKVLFGTDARLITEHAGNTLTLQIPFDSRLQTGDQIDAYPGCDGNASTCKNKYNNKGNFLGMPYIPSKNPAIVGFT